MSAVHISVRNAKPIALAGGWTLTLYCSPNSLIRTCCLMPDWASDVLNNQEVYKSGLRKVAHVTWDENVLVTFTLSSSLVAESKTYRKDLTSSPLLRICSTMWSQLPGFDLDLPAPVPLYREAPAGLPRTPRGPPRWPPPPGPVWSWPRLWEVTGGSLGPGGGWWVRGCWRLCCRTRGRGRATAEDGMCSKVEADERDASPKLSGHMGVPRKTWKQQGCLVTNSTNRIWRV